MSQLVNIINNTLVIGTKRIQSSIMIGKREGNFLREIIQKESKKEKKKEKEVTVGWREGRSLEVLELCLWNIFLERRSKKYFFLHKQEREMTEKCREKEREKL